MKCGFYEVEITPPLGTTIFGYFIPRVSDGIDEKLYAKAAVLEQGGVYAAFLAVDAMCLPEGLTEVVRKRVNEKTGIDENAILIAATHSHTSGPVYKDGGGYKGIRLSEQDPVLNVELDNATIDRTALLAADAVILAFQRLQPVNVRFGMGQAEGISFVREYYLKDGTVRTNPFYCKSEAVKSYSDPDTDLPVFFFTDEEGKPVGAITSFALHHDTVGGSQISSDYSGLVGKQMKRVFGDQFVTVFYQGFCGNINHLDYCAPGEGPAGLTTREISDVLTKELLYTIAKAEPVQTDEFAVKMDTVKVKKRVVDQDFLDSVVRNRENPPAPGPISIEDPYSDIMQYLASNGVIARYITDTKTEYDVPVQVIQIGDCMIYSLVGEVFSQFGEKIKAGSPTKKNLLVSMAHTLETYCYIPIPEMFLPYVYESSIYSAPLETAAGDKMADKALEIARSL
ncbi:MAG: hypothetical protein E7293_01635 [Lachnospiraceae bacterium]|nr:hypothetical protein [Lachnospiraceae bacterium]